MRRKATLAALVSTLLPLSAQAPDIRVTALNWGSTNPLRWLAANVPPHVQIWIESNDERIRKFSVQVQGPAGTASNPDCTRSGPMSVCFVALDSPGPLEVTVEAFTSAGVVKNRF